MSSGYPEPLQQLIEELARLPGIGTRTAERLAFYILKCDDREAMQLAIAIRDVKKKLLRCKECFNVAEQESCRICNDPGRDHGLVMVVEHPKDLAAFERTGRYKGVYHVLLGRLSPHDGSGPEHISAAGLVARVGKGQVREVILATNPDAEGDATALLLERMLAASQVPVTRLARGLATGGAIDFAGTEMLAEALENRRPGGAAKAGGRAS
jgi:recombination protein RecR